MIDAYTIGIKLTIASSIYKDQEKVLAGFKAINKEALNSREAIKGATAELTKMAARVQSMIARVQQIAQLAAKGKAEIKGSDAEVQKMTAHIKRLEAELNKATDQTQKGRRALASSSDEVMKMTERMRKLERALAETNGEAGKTQPKIKSATAEVGKLTAAAHGLKSAFGGVNSTINAMAAGLAALGGLRALKNGLETTIGAAADQRHAQLKIGFAGTSPEGMSKINAQAKSLTQSRGDMSQTEYTNMMGVIYGTLQNADEAVAIAPAAADYMTMMRLNGHPVTDEGLGDALKIIEARKKLFMANGHDVDVASVANQFNLIGQTSIRTHDQVNAHTLRAGVGMMGAQNASRQDDEAFYGYGPEMMNAMRSGSKVGTAITATMRQLETGVMNKTILRAAIDNGWVHKYDANHKQLIQNAGNGRVNLLPGAVDDAAGLARNPYKWFSEHLDSARKLRQAKEKDPSHIVTNAEVISKSFQTGTSARAAAEVDAIIGLLHRFSEGIMKASREHPLDQTAADIRKKDPATVVASFQAAWTDLMAALGSPLLDPALGYMAQFTETVKGWTAWASSHGAEVKEIAETLIGTGSITAGLIALYGAVALLGPVMLAFGVGAVAYEALQYLTGETGLKALTTGFTMLKDAIKGIPTVIDDAIKAFKDQLGWGKGGLLENILGFDPKYIGLGPSSPPAAPSHEMSPDARYAAESVRAQLRGEPAPVPVSPGALATTNRGNGLFSQMPRTSGGAATPPSPFARLGITAPPPGSPVDPKPGDFDAAMKALIPGFNSGPVATGKRVSFVPPASNGGAVTIENVMYLDGDVAHRSVTKRMAKAATLPSSSYGGFDGSRTPTTAGVMLAV